MSIRERRDSLLEIIKSNIGKVNSKKLHELTGIARGTIKSDLNALTVFRDRDGWLYLNERDTEVL